jgi:hypothetical protein
MSVRRQCEGQTHKYGSVCCLFHSPHTPCLPYPCCAVEEDVDAVYGFQSHAAGIPDRIVVPHLTGHQITTTRTSLATVPHATFPGTFQGGLRLLKSFFLNLTRRARGKRLGVSPASAASFTMRNRYCRAYLNRFCGALNRADFSAWDNLTFEVAPYSSDKC